MTVEVSVMVMVLVIVSVMVLVIVSVMVLVIVSVTVMVVVAVTVSPAVVVAVIVSVIVVVLPSSAAADTVSSSLLQPCKDRDAMKPKQMAMKARKSCIMKTVDAENLGKCFSGLKPLFLWSPSSHDVHCQHMSALYLLVR